MLYSCNEMRMINNANGWQIRIITKLRVRSSAGQPVYREYVDAGRWPYLSGDRGVRRLPSCLRPVTGHMAAPSLALQ